MRSAMRAASQIPGRGPLMWMMPLHLHINQKSDYDDYDELGIFLYNSRFLFSFLCSVNLCQLNGDSCLVNTYIICSSICLKIYTHGQKLKVRIFSSEQS